MNRIEWLKDRQKGIGGSDAAAACGMSKWKTRYQLYLDKTEPVTESEDTPAFYWGRMHERTIRQAYAERFECTVFEYSEPFVSEEFPWMRVNVDGVTEHTRLFEAKTSRDSRGWGPDGSNEIPDEYNLQIQHSLIVIPGLEGADLAALIGGSDFRIYHIAPDPELQSMIVELERDFWRHVELGVAQEIETLEDARHRYSINSVEGLKDASEDAVQHIRRLNILRAEIKQAESEIEQITLEIQKEIKDSDGLQFQGKPLVTWKSSKGVERTDFRSIVEELGEKVPPELIERFTKFQNGSRRFLPKEVKA